MVNIEENKTAELAESLKTCNKDALSYIDKMKFSDAEINLVSNRLRTIYKRSASVFQYGCTNLDTVSLVVDLFSIFCFGIEKDVLGS